MLGITALEIFSNPGDLEFAVAQDKEVDGKWAIGICRGPGHNYKILITSEPFAETLDAALDSVKETLDSIYEAVTAELGDPTSLATGILNPDSREIHPSNTLNPELIARIMVELREKQQASTCTMNVGLTTS